MYGVGGAELLGGGTALQPAHEVCPALHQHPHRVPQGLQVLLHGGAPPDATVFCKVPHCQVHLRREHSCMCKEHVVVRVVLLPHMSLQGLQQLRCSLGINLARGLPLGLVVLYRSQALALKGAALGSSSAVPLLQPPASSSWASESAAESAVSLMEPEGEAVAGSSADSSLGRLQPQTLHPQ
eukprot:CAMPEP_0202917166 /NCGR_PEP_ID=MMETSP1392-20130828/70370_1 /ASSEMBLY_ACC=CAM_ASM_000868 /TAXON_ID=225041 /ORGANISM="Chlamydomonas chlamydogama, Strain SAG 11-48b" /LENGTH=181 /DNA_ID=CAMNT_0049609827 /DNA_START=976 /DNA_END=1522 /DNA_ORIENTATION=+